MSNSSRSTSSWVVACPQDISHSDISSDLSFEFDSRRDSQVMPLVIDRPYVRPPGYRPPSPVPERCEHLSIEELPSTSARDNTESDVARLSLKLASEIIPKFDGKSMPVRKFTKLCREVWEAVKPSERKFLAPIVKQKIIKDAESYVRRQDTDNLEELLKTLERAFTPRHTLDTLQTRMSNVYQEQGESAFKYGNRVRELLDDILDAIDRENNPDFEYGLRNRAVDNACSCYVTGLNSAIEMPVRQGKPATLQAAIDLAMDEEEHQKNRDRVRREKTVRYDRRERDQERRIGTRRFRDNIETVQINEIRATRNNDDYRSPLYCRTCRKPGHTSVNCNNFKRREIPTCAYCNRKGHNESNCYTKRDRERRGAHTTSYAVPKGNLNSDLAFRDGATKSVAIKSRPNSTKLVTISTGTEQRNSPS